MNFLIFAVIALWVLPVAFVRLCRAMKASGVANPPVKTFFFSFGTLGGISVGLALAPSPLMIFCFLPILLASMLAFIAALRLEHQSATNSRYDRMAIMAGSVAGIPFLLLAGLLVFELLFGAVGHR